MPTTDTFVPLPSGMVAKLIPISSGMQAGLNSQEAPTMAGQNTVPASPMASQADMRHIAAPANAPTDINAMIDVAAQKYQVNPQVLKNMAMTESSNNPNAVGQPTKYGTAQGLMQMLPTTAAKLGIDPHDPAQSIDGAARLMRENLDRYNGNYTLAAAAYHGGTDMKNWGPKTLAYTAKVNGVSSDAATASNTGGFSPLPPQLAALYPLPNYDAPPVAEVAKNSSPTLGDYVKALAAGTNNVVTTVGEAAKLLGADKVGPDIRDFGQSGEDYWNQSMTPAGQTAMSNPVIKDDMTLGDTPFSTVALNAVQSVPGMVAMFFPGMAVTKVLEIPKAMRIAKIAAGLVEKGEDINKAQQMAGVVDDTIAQSTRLGRVRAAAPSAIGMGASEGVFSGMQNAAQSAQQIAAMPQEELDKSPYYQDVLAGTDQSLPMAQRQAVARQAVSNAVEKEVAGNTVLLTGAIGAVTGGGILGQMARPSRGAVREMLSGLRSEATQETLQSGEEQYVQNKAAKEYANPDQSLSEDVVNQAVTGGLAGGLLGAGGGALHGAGGHVPSEQANKQEDTNAPVDANIVLDNAEGGPTNAAPEGQFAAGSEPQYRGDDAVVGANGQNRQYPAPQPDGSASDSGGGGAAQRPPTADARIAKEARPGSPRSGAINLEVPPVSDIPTEGVGTPALGRGASGAEIPSAPFQPGSEVIPNRMPEGRGNTTPPVEVASAVETGSQNVQKPDDIVTKKGTPFVSEQAAKLHIVANKLTDRIPVPLAAKQWVARKISAVEPNAVSSESAPPNSPPPGRTAEPARPTGKNPTVGASAEAPEPPQIPPVKQPKQAHQVPTDARTLYHDLAYAGGLNMDELKSQGIDPAVITDKKFNNRLFGYPLFRKNGGMTLAHAAEKMAELGYIPTDEHGKHDDNAALPVIGRLLMGDHIISPHNSASVNATLDRMQLDREEAPHNLDEYTVDGYDGLAPDLQEEAQLQIRAMMELGEDEGEALLERLAIQSMEMKPADAVAFMTKQIEEATHAQKSRDRVSAAQGAQRGQANVGAVQGAESDLKLETQTEQGLRDRKKHIADKQEAADKKKAEDGARDNFTLTPTAIPTSAKMPDMFKPSVKTLESVDDRRHEQAPVAKEQRKGERRQDATLRERIAKMSPEEKDAELLKQHTDELTGLGNRKAWMRAEKLPYVASIDLDGLKWINDNMGHPTGDEAIKALGHALGDSSDKAYHLSGDEFIVQAKTKAELKAAMAKTRDALKAHELTGQDVKKTGVEFSHGIGASMKESELALRENKKSKPNRGAEPPGVTREAEPAQTPPKSGVSDSGLSDSVVNPPEHFKSADDAVAAADEAIAKKTINKEYRIPYLGGASKDGKTIYFDKSMPETIDVDGVKINLHRSVGYHESVEFPRMRGPIDKLSYAGAHQIATGAERAYVEAHAPEGMDKVEFFDHYQAEVKKLVETAKESGEGKLPPDLDTKPYVDSGETHLVGAQAEVIDSATHEAETSPKNDKPKTTPDPISHAINTYTTKDKYLHYLVGRLGKTEFAKQQSEIERRWNEKATTSEAPKVTDQAKSVDGSKPLTPELALTLRNLAKITENARQGIRKFDPKSGPRGEYQHETRAKATTRQANLARASEYWIQKRAELGKALRDAAKSGYEVPKEYIDLAGSAFEYDEKGNYSPVDSGSGSKQEPVEEKKKQVKSDAADQTKETDQGTAMFSRKANEAWRIDSKDDLPTVAAKLLAQDDDFFANPISKEKSFEAVMKDIAPEFTVKKVAIGGDVKQGYELWTNKPDGEMVGPVRVMVNKDGTVELDISKFGEGKRGNAIYQAVGDFAYNNGLKFIGDRAGLSPIAQIRRTEQMLSSALRHGTTRHLGGHYLLENPEVKGVEPLRWQDGNDAHNLREMVRVTRKTIENLVPEIADIGYNFKTRRFEDSNGNEVTDQDFKDLATSARTNKLSVGRRTGGVQYETPVGWRTLKRSALFNSLARAESGTGEGGNGRRNDILAEISRQLSEHSLDPALQNLAYKRTTEPRPRAVVSFSSVSDVEAALSKPLAAMRRLFDVHVVQSAADVPGDFPSDIGGVYDDGKVYLVADNIPVGKELEILAHEAVGHLGIEKLLGPQMFNDVLSMVQTQKRLGNRRIAEIVDRLKQNYVDKHGNYVLDDSQEAQEILAHIAEGKAKLISGSPLSRIYERVKTAVRSWLAAHGFGSPENALIDSLISKAARFVQNDRSELPTMTEAVSQPAFKRARIIGDSGRQYTDEQRRAMERTGSVTHDLNATETLHSLWHDAGKKLAQGLVDQFAPVKDITAKGYTLLRLAKGATGAFEAFMHHGKLSLRDGTYDADTSGGVLERVFYPLGRETTDFLRWVAGNRAERLAGEGKEHLFSPDDIAAFKSLDTGTTTFDYPLQNGRSTRDRTLIYRDALKQFNEFNKNVLDMAEQSGLIDPASRALWEHEFYVPFYRIADESDGGVRGMNIKSGVIRQEAFKKLKGGDQQLNDLLSNTLMNWAHLIDAAAKNRAAAETLQSAERMGAARKAVPGEKNTVWFMDGGKKVEYKVDDPYLMTAISSLEYAGLRGPAMKALSTFKHMLTMGVTASPFFKIRNLIRDSIQSIATSDISGNPIKNIKEGFALTHHDRQEYVSALAGGGLIRFGTMLEGNEAARTRQLIKLGTKDTTILDSESKVRAFYDKYLEPSISAYNELGNRGEEINRMALYDHLIKKGTDHATASLMARDLMDFGLQGAWTSIRFLNQVVPFMNARVQGLYKLGRAGKGNPAKMAATIGAVTLGSLALLAAYHSDDDWKKREDWDRDNYWWFKLGGMAFRIPKPFEIGAIATLAERAAEYMFDDEMTGKRFRARVIALLSNQLSMNPVPQLIKPIIDVYANQDSFTNRPIEPAGMARLAPDYRFNQSTSMVARGISTAGNALTDDNFFSPLQIDHLVQSYFGWLGAFVVGGADMAVRAMNDEPVRPAIDYWKLATGSMLSSLDGAPSRYVTQIYQQAQEMEQAYGTWRMLIKQGKTQDAADFKSANQADILSYGRVAKTKRAMGMLNDLIKVIERSNADADTKREKINALRARQDQIAKNLSTATVQ